MTRNADRSILGESPAIKSLLGLIRQVSPTKTNILIIGESGTGKELVARMIHEQGPLKEKPFVPVNCGAIPETLIESEMFGHKRGSFTGAVSDKQGLFEVAHGGTLFLDEVGELPVSMQVKLLRSIQERSIRKVGGTEDIRVDVRIIAATNRNLEEAIARGTFREDLYYRLNVILIKTPSLRERKGDIRLLAESFLAKTCRKYNKALKGLDQETIDALESYTWPGNVRELENVVERAVTLENSEFIMLSALPASVLQGPRNSSFIPNRRANDKKDSDAINNEIRLLVPDFSNGPIDLDHILGEVERTYLESALSYTSGVKKKAADLLGITFRSIRYRLKKLGVNSGDDEGGE